MNILLLDIENSPNIGYAWGYWQQNLSGIVQESRIIAFNAKWLGGETISRTLPDYKGYKAGKLDDSKITADLWALFDKADIIVAHNGDNFDIKKVNARIIAHGYMPPSPYLTVDTKKIAKRIFGFPANSLNELCLYLGLGKKGHTGGFDLWTACMSGDLRMWEKMREYNAHDVVLLEKLYYRLLPWINNHPNTSEELKGCPKCGSTMLQKRGTARTRTREYQRLQCQICNGWSRSNKTTKSAMVVNG